MQPSGNGGLSFFGVGLTGAGNSFEITLHFFVPFYTKRPFPPIAPVFATWYSRVAFDIFYGRVYPSVFPLLFLPDEPAFKSLGG